MLLRRDPLPLRVHVSAIAFVTAAIDAGAKVSTYRELSSHLSSDDGRAPPPAGLAAEIASAAAAVDVRTPPLPAPPHAASDAPWVGCPSHVWQGLRATLRTYGMLVGAPGSDAEGAWTRLCVSASLPLDAEDLAAWADDSEDCEVEWEVRRRLYRDMHMACVFSPAR